jgi:predicted nucleic acid-binding protein
MNLFIDTNIYLTFYHFTSEDLEELKKLLVAIENKEITLYVTELVVMEYNRNREAKISDALKKFAAQKPADQFPQICKEYEEFNNLKNAVKDYEIAKNKIIKKLYADIEKNTLRADKIISDLFGKAKLLEMGEFIINKAKTRFELGNPPRKNTSYGDSINWEILLEMIPKGEDLYLITDDKDYISPVDDNKLLQFLKNEWSDKKHTRIFFYRRLSVFFRDKYPDIKLASELEKELAITALVNSTNFQATHAAISKLNKFTDFSDSQIIAIIKASITNNQIYLINEDEDVNTFLNNLITSKENIIDPNELEVFEAYFQQPSPGIENHDDIPF